MPIQVNCPNCGKEYRLKDEMAGKRATCKECRKPFPIPAPVSAPADLEAFAASALADEPKSAEPEVPTSSRTTTFKCPMCDTEVTVSAELEGKRTPCPDCRRIVLVPKTVKEDPKDWRKVKSGGPSMAKRDEPAAPEGAWGSAQGAGTVSKQALIDANVLPTQKETVPTAVKVKRAAWVATALVVVGLVGWGALAVLSSSRQKKAVELALASTRAESTPPLAQAEVQRALGEHYLRANTPEETTKAKQAFGQARGLAAGVAAGRERDRVLTDVALSQIELGGDGDDVALRRRLSWQDALKEIGQTLEPLGMRDPQAPPDMLAAGARVSAAAAVLARLRSKGQGALAAQWLPMVFPAGDEMRAEGLARMGLALHKVDTEAATALADLALQSYPQPEGEVPLEKRPIVAPSLVALCYALQKPHALVGLADGEAPQRGAAPGYAAVFALAGKSDQARRALGDAPPAYRLQALTIQATHTDDPGKAAVDEAITLVEREKGRLPNGLVLELARLGVEHGATERLTALAAALPDPAVKGLVQLEVLRTQLADPKAAPPTADGVDAAAVVAHGLARAAVTRARARSDGNVVKEVGGWDEALRPYGYAGAVLGLGDGKK